MSNDPVFSVDGDLALNWEYHNNGCRIALTNRYLSKSSENRPKTYGIGTGYVLKNEDAICENQNLTCYAMQK